MSKKTHYKQCIVEKQELGKSCIETVTQITWLPVEFAEVDKQIQLKDDDDNWTDGWKVKYVGEDALYEDYLPDFRKAIRGHRKNTGDSLPV